MGNWFIGVSSGDKDCYWDNVLCCLFNWMIFFLKFVDKEVSIVNM